MNLTNFVDTLSRIISLKDSRPLTFDVEHIFKTLQLLNAEKYVSRATLCKELDLGEGSVKTIILHMKKSGYVDSIKAGTFLLERGQKLIQRISQYLPAEIQFDETKYLQSFNHAILLKNTAQHIVDGMRQRDFAIKKGAKSALTLICKESQFLLAIKERPYLINDEKLVQDLTKLNPGDGDVIIVVSADSAISAEMAAKFSALGTFQDISTISLRIL